jgi:hypothetical protein
MTKIKKLKIRSWYALGLLCLVAVIGVGFTIRAYSSNGNAPKAVTENGDIIFNEAQDIVPTGNTMEDGVILGSLTSPDITSSWLCVNGDCTYHITGDMINASTTIVSIPDPFLVATSSANDVVLSGTTNNGYGYTGATSTVELVRLNQTGTATTTYGITCGAASTPTGTPAYNILATGVQAIATSTDFGAIENDITASYGAGITGGSIPKILLTPVNPYLVCNVATTGYDGGFTDIGNTFDGKYGVRVSRTRF